MAKEKLEDYMDLYYQFIEECLENGIREEIICSYGEFCEIHEKCLEFERISKEREMDEEDEYWFFYPLIERLSEKGYRELRESQKEEI